MDVNGHTVSRRFNAPDSDISLLSSDNVLFKVHRINLKMHSDIFADADDISTFKPSNQQAPEIVALAEHSTVLSILLRYMYRQPPPDLSALAHDDFPLLEQIAEAAEKYRVFFAIDAAVRALRLSLPTNPFQILSFAIKHKHPSLVDAAAEWGLRASSLVMGLVVPPPSRTRRTRSITSDFDSNDEGDDGDNATDNDNGTPTAMNTNAAQSSDGSVVVDVDVSGSGSGGGGMGGLGEMLAPSIRSAWIAYSSNHHTLLQHQFLLYPPTTHHWNPTSRDIDLPCDVWAVGWGMVVSRLGAGGVGMMLRDVEVGLDLGSSVLGDGGNADTTGGGGGVNNALPPSPLHPSSSPSSSQVLHTALIQLLSPSSNPNPSLSPSVVAAGNANANGNGVGIGINGNGVRGTMGINTLFRPAEEYVKGKCGECRETLEGWKKEMGRSVERIGGFSRFVGV